MGAPFCSGPVNSVRARRWVARLRAGNIFMKAWISRYTSFAKDILRIFLRSILTGAIVTAACAAYAKDLWEDHNPYSTTGQVVAGTVLKLQVEAPVIIEYEYERKTDEKATIKITPDPKITDFLPAANSEKTINGSEKLVLKAKSRLVLNMAVTVQGDGTGKTLQITGTRQIGYENDRARQLIQVTGRVNRADIRQDLTVHSDQVADLVILITGAPVPQNAGIQMKQKPEAGGQPQPAAELSNEEKQKLLLDHLNRILGESR